MFELIPFGRTARSVAEFDPFREFDEIERSIFGGSRAMTAFRTDVIDTGDAFKLEAELPGFKKEDIQLDLKDNILTIKAEHKENHEEKDDNGSYIRRERRYGSFARTFDVTGIDENAITASYENGILCLALPKQVPAQPERRQIAIN